MGYFSNGTEGMNYEARYCDRCIHEENPDGSGCTIWLAHMLWNYDQHKDESVKKMLDILIPRNKDGLGNEQCTMFVATRNK